AADDAGTVGKDLVSASSDVIGAARADRFYRSNNTLLLLVANSFHGGINLLRGGSASSRTVDMQDDGFDRVIIAVPAQLRHHRLSFSNYAFEIDNGDFVAEASAVLSRFACFAQAEIEQSKDRKDKDEEDTGAQQNPQPGT